MQNSIDPTRIGGNVTGLQTSPKHSKAMTEMADALPAADPDSQPLAEVRADYIRDADKIGSIPAPATLKGMAKSGAQMMKGNRPQAYIDKLAERLAFERGGVRLYDAVLAKFAAHGDELSGVSLADVQEIRDDEARHAILIKECIEKLGADPTAQTPSADLVGVETMGLLQAAADPRTTLAQTLHAAITAELADGAGWEMLTEMAEGMGQKDVAKLFRTALEEEAQHLAKVKSWHKALVMETKTVG